VVLLCLTGCGGGGKVGGVDASAAGTGGGGTGGSGTGGAPDASGDGGPADLSANDALDASDAPDASDATDAPADRGDRPDATGDGLVVGDGRPLNPPGASICSGGGWCWLNPLPQGNDLAAMRAFSPSDIWAVGASGTALHFDGHSWTGVTGADEDDFKGVWGAKPDDVWLIGIGSAYHWNGARLSLVPDGPEGIAIFGSGASDVWTVSYGGLISHFDGQAWSDVTSPTSGALYAGWANAANDAWIGGDGEMLHWDGQVWKRVANTGVSAAVRGVWSSGAQVNDLWVLMDGGIRRWNGTTWTSIAGTPAYGKAIHGTSPTDVWITGTDSTSHYDGTAWTTHANPTSCWGTAVAAAAASGVWVGGQRGCLAAWRNQDGAWSTPYPVSYDVIEELDDMWGSGPSDIWTVGGTNDVNGSLTHWDGTTWTRTHLGTQQFRVVWGSGPTDVWAVTWKGAFAHFDGTAWAFTGLTTSATFGGPKRLWGRARDDIWLTGVCGTMHYDGVSWTETPWKGDCPQLIAVGGSAAGEMWGVGSYGRIARLTGGMWAPFNSPTDQTLSDIVVLAANEAWAVGDSGTFVHWNGTGWALAPPVGVNTLTRVWASGPSDVWAAGQIGALRHFDGSAWSISESGASATFNGIWGQGPGDLWAVGIFGTILRHRGGM
jgi:hypothetical protein